MALVTLPPAMVACTLEPDGLEKLMTLPPVPFWKLTGEVNADPEFTVMLKSPPQAAPESASNPATPLNWTQCPEVGVDWMVASELVLAPS